MKLSPHQHQMLDQTLKIIAAAEAGPSAKDLADAPLIEFWQPVLCGTRVALWGEVSGHPHLGNAAVVTSQLIALDVAAGWARTISRWYRLGQSYEQFEIDLAKELGNENSGPNNTHFELNYALAINDPAELARLLTRFIQRIRSAHATAWGGE